MNTTSTAAATAASIFTGPVSRYLIADLEQIAKLVSYGVRLGRRFVATHGSEKRKPRELRAEVARARTIYGEWEADR